MAGNDPRSDGTEAADAAINPPTDAVIAPMAGQDLGAVLRARAGRRPVAAVGGSGWPVELPPADPLATPATPAWVPLSREEREGLIRALHAVQQAVTGNAAASEALFDAARAGAACLLAGDPAVGAAPADPLSLEALADWLTGDPQVLHWVDAEQAPTLLLWPSRQIGSRAARLVAERTGAAPVAPPRETFVLFLERLFPRQRARLLIGFTPGGSSRLLFDATDRVSELERLAPVIARVRRALGLTAGGEAPAEAADRRYREARAAFRRDLTRAGQRLLRNYERVPSRTRLALELGTSRSRLADNFKKYDVDYGRDVERLRRGDPVSSD
jgi:hypothetical protein